MFCLSGVLVFKCQEYIIFSGVFCKRRENSLDFMVLFYGTPESLIILLPSLAFVNLQVFSSALSTSFLLCLVCRSSSAHSLRSLLYPKSFSNLLRFPRSPSYSTSSHTFDSLLLDLRTVANWVFWLPAFFRRSFPL